MSFIVLSLKIPDNKNNVCATYGLKCTYFFMSILVVIKVFEKYVKERADEERKERKQKAKEIKDKFRELLEE